MRLIDADALMATLGITDIDCNKCARCDKEWSRCKRGSDFEDACCAIENAPTIEERKTGKWMEDAETYYKAVNEKGGGVDENTPYFTEDNIACSECLTMFSVIDNCTEDFDFCPKCGADMMEQP